MGSIKGRRRDKVGVAPGTIKYFGDTKTSKVSVEVIRYDRKSHSRKVISDIKECSVSKDKVTWINIDGIHDTEIVQDIEKLFKIHPLITEDIVTPGQRPKLEDMGSYIYIVLNMIYPKNDSTSELVIEQVSLILGKNYVISFQENPKDVFDPIRKRIESGKGYVRSYGADYLAYALIDAIVDHYFIVLESHGEKIDRLEDEMIGNPSQNTLREMYRLKRNIICLSKSVWPLRSIISNFTKSDSGYVGKAARIFMRDIYDHLIHATDTIEIYRSILSEMVEIYLNSISNRLNEIMKVLTIFSTIFMPLSFLVGVWGMNFKHMPELDWEWGYPASILIMLFISGIMLMFFRRKRWI